MAKSTRTKTANETPVEADKAEVEAAAKRQADAEAKAEAEAEKEADEKAKAEAKAEQEAKDKADAEFLEAELAKEEEDAKAKESVDNDKVVPVAEKKKEEPVVEGNYLNQPKALRDAQASQEHIHTPTGTRLTPPMNPFMKMEQERESKRIKASVPTAADMAAKIKTELKIDTTADFALGSIVAKLNNYVTSMAPNTPVTPEFGARWQAELAKCFFEALAASPEASLASLNIIKLYFKTYSGHTMSRSHVFRFMDRVRLEQHRLIGFQSLLHLFVELGQQGDRTNKEIQREVNISKIAEAVSDNTDAQIRLVEFLN